MKFSSIFLLVLIINIAMLFYKVEFKNPSTKKLDKSSNIKVRLNKVITKQQRLSKRRSQKQKELKNKDHFKQAFFKKVSSLRLQNTEIYNASPDGLSRKLTLFDLLEEQLIYPSAFHDLKIFGGFVCDLIISSNQINTDLSHCQGNRLLKTYVLNTLASILNHQIKIKFLKIKIIARYRLSPSPYKLGKSLHTDHFYFYRQSFGSETTTQKIAEKSIKVLTHIQNFLSLLEYLPNKKKVLRNKRFFDSLFQSAYINL